MHKIWGATDFHQLMSGLLTDTDWYLNFDDRYGFDITTLFNIPAGVFSVDGKTIIDVLADGIRAVGGMMQAHRYENQILLFSRFPTSPKTWTPANAERTIPLQTIISQSTKWRPAPKYNCINVAGGVKTLVVRTGADIQLDRNQAGEVKHLDTFHSYIN
jgi:hypothetical protein